MSNNSSMVRLFVSFNWNISPLLGDKHLINFAMICLLNFQIMERYNFLSDSGEFFFKEPAWQGRGSLHFLNFGARMVHNFKMIRI